MKKFISKIMTRLGLENQPRLKKIVVGVIGCTVVLIGIALIVLPGPAMLVIPAGLAILATEFIWARRLMRKAGVAFERAKARFKK